MAHSHRLPDAAGIGLRLPHLAEVVATRPAVAWLEVHPENFLANPHVTELLTELSPHYPIPFTRSASRLAAPTGSIGRTCSGCVPSSTRSIRSWCPVISPGQRTRAYT